MPGASAGQIVDVEAEWLQNELGFDTLLVYRLTQLSPGNDLWRIEGSILIIPAPSAAALLTLGLMGVRRRRD